MGAVVLVVRRRLARRWRALTVVGILLGIGFGVSLASFGAARRTASAYDRLLAASDAPDAAVALGHGVEESVRSLRNAQGVVRQRVYAGFLGTAAGVDPVYTTALLAPTGREFPLEQPTVQSGRMPDPDAPDEVFVNAGAAAGGGLVTGRRLHFTFFTPGSSADVDETVTMVGTGTLPAEIARDETNVLGLVVFTRAFYAAHRDLTVYSVSNVDLAPGFDARTDLAPAVADLGHDLQSARSQERQSVNEALRPLVIALVALGLLAFAATAVAVAQVMQRDRDRWRPENATLLRVGMTRGQLRLIQLTAAGADRGARGRHRARRDVCSRPPSRPSGRCTTSIPRRATWSTACSWSSVPRRSCSTVALCAIAFSPLPVHAIRIRAAAVPVDHVGRARPDDARGAHARVPRRRRTHPDLARRGRDDAGRHAVRHRGRECGLGHDVDRHARALRLRRGSARGEPVRRPAAGAAGAGVRR